jgi:hypothetical protein
MLRCDSPIHKRVWIVALRLGTGAALVRSSLAAMARSAAAAWGAASTASAWHVATMYSATVNNRSAIAAQSVVSIQLSRSSAGGKEGVEIVIVWDGLWGGLC